MGRFFTRWEHTDDGRAVFREGGRKGDVFYRDRWTPVAVENFYALKDGQTSDTPTGERSLRNRVNLLNWDGDGSPKGLFPDSRDQPRTPPSSPADLHGRGPATDSAGGSAGSPSVSP